MTSNGAAGGGGPAVTLVTFRLRASLTHRSLAIDLVSTLIEHISTADRSFRNAMTTAFGSNTLEQFIVITEEVPGA